jgi:hypothetical protein
VSYYEYKDRHATVPITAIVAIISGVLIKNLINIKIFNLE